MSKNQESNQEKTKKKNRPILDVELKIIEQAKLLAKHKISSCYEMVQLTKKLIEMEDAAKLNE